MARPPTPPPVWSDITLDLWEKEPPWMDAVKEMARSEGYQVMHTVLVNERPSRAGERDASFSLGYEDCLAKMEHLAKGRARQQAEQQGEPDYIAPSTLDDLAWRSTGK